MMLENPDWTDDYANVDEEDWDNASLALCHMTADAVEEYFEGGDLI